MSSKVPEAWSVRRLGSLATGKAEYGANVSKTALTPHWPRYIRITDIDDNGALRPEAVSISPEDAAPYLLQPDDVLIARSGATVGKSYLYQVSDGPCAFAGYLIRFRFNHAEVLPRYVAQYLHSSCFWDWLASTVREGAQPNVNAQEYSNFEILVPPLPEQRKIAAILSSVDEAIQATQAVIEQTRRVKEGLLQELLTKGIGHTRFKQTEIGEIPEEWEVKRLGEMIYHFDSGWSPNCDAEPAQPHEWAILKTTAVVWDGYNPLENKRLPRNLEPKLEAETKTDDILITRKGPVERVGVVAHVRQTPPKRMIPDTIIRIRVGPTTEILPSYVSFALSSGRIQNSWKGQKVGLAAAQVNVNSKIIKSTMVALPPLEEQRLISERMFEAADVLDHQQKQIGKLHSLKAGLLQDLLTGKVRVSV